MVFRKRYRIGLGDLEGPGSSHLFFANDFIMFGEASDRQVKVVIKVLKFL